MEGERALTKEEMQKMALAVRNKAYKIANAKGSTYYGIGACTTNICRNILGNRRIVTQLSVYNPVFKTYMSWPAIMGRTGTAPGINFSARHLYCSCFLLDLHTYLLTLVPRTLAHRIDVQLHPPPKNYFQAWFAFCRFG